MFFFVIHSGLYNQFRVLNKWSKGMSQPLPATGHLLDFSLSVSLGHVVVKRGKFLDRLVRK